MSESDKPSNNETTPDSDWTVCLGSDDQTHCNCWYDGAECCYCGGYDGEEE